MSLVDELSFLSSLPAALSERLSARPEGSSPPLVIVYLSSLKVRKWGASLRCSKTADGRVGQLVVLVGAAGSFSLLLLFPYGNLEFALCYLAPSCLPPVSPLPSVSAYDNVCTSYLA